MVVVAAVYGLRVIRRAFHGPALVAGVDLAWRERLLVLPLLLLIIVVGAAPWLVIDRVPAEVLPVAGAVR